MKIDVVTIFPTLFEPFRQTALFGAAVREGIVELAVHDLRDWTSDRHRSVDDTPYGGGPGMVMRPEPLVAAIEALAGPKGAMRRAEVLLLSPQGRRFEQKWAETLSRASHLVLVCGRYEGVDQRAIEVAVDREVSIGDYVLAGGELPALVVIEAVTRLIAGVMGNPASAETESFQSSQSPETGQGLLEGPHYTRPASFRGLEVPSVLRSGDHQAIARWRALQARETTRERRPDLLGPTPGKDER